jgi:hypothetical protein
MVASNFMEHYFAKSYHDSKPCLDQNVGRPNVVEHNETSCNQCQGRQKQLSIAILLNMRNQNFPKNLPTAIETVALVEFPS